MKRLVMAMAFVLAAYLAHAATAEPPNSVGTALGHRTRTTQPTVNDAAAVWPENDVAFDPLKIRPCFYVKGPPGTVYVGKFATSTDPVLAQCGRSWPVPRMKLAVV